MKFLIKSVRILWLLAAPAAAQAQGPILETPPDLSSAPNRACYRAILTRAPARIDLCGPDKVHPLARIRAHQVLGAKLRLAKINTAIVEAAKDNTCARKPDCAAALQNVYFLKDQYRRELRAARAQARKNRLQP